MVKQGVEAIDYWDRLVVQFAANGCNPAQRYALSVEVRRRWGRIQQLAGYLETLWAATPPDAAEGPMFDERIRKFGAVQAAYEEEVRTVAGLEDVLWNRCCMRLSTS